MSRFRFSAPLVVMTVSWVVLAGAAAAREPYLPTFAAPEIVIAHGGPLPGQRVIARWHDNHKLLSGVVASPLPDSLALARRTAVRLALFWGASWRATAESPELLRALRPERASQQGMFYPATASAPALLLVGSTAGVVSDSGLAVLRRHGVPVRVTP